MIDVETDGPIPGDFSMISFGAVLVNEELDQTFYGRLKPISERWVPEALAVSGHSREETMAFDDPKQVMQDFAVWVNERSKRRPLFISDNNGFDWQFINWYFWHFTDGNPFGHTSTNLGSLQGVGAGHIPELQTPEKNCPHASSCRRCEGQRRGPSGNEKDGP